MASQERKSRRRGKAFYYLSVEITEEKFKRYPANLSGGEQQRVAIARTLATGAQVLLADEPSGNLDQANGDKLIEILGQLAHEQGYCVIIVTYDPSIAERSDRSGACPMVF
jgi:putative ABC transport system ATP-binding protein